MLDIFDAIRPFVALAAVGLSLFWLVSFVRSTCFCGDILGSMVAAGGFFTSMVVFVYSVPPIYQFKGFL